MGKTLAEKIWNEHIVSSKAGEPDLLYIDLHLIHEVTSPQAFDGLRLANRKVRRPELTIATEDHNVPTLNIDKPIADPVSKLQVDTLFKILNNPIEVGENYTNDMSNLFTNALLIVTQTDLNDDV